MSRSWTKSLCSKGGHFERKFQGEWGVAHQRVSFWAIVWHYLRDSSFSRLSRTPTCDTRMDGRTHDKYRTSI